MTLKSIFSICLTLLATFVFSQSKELVGNVEIENAADALPLNQIIIVNKNTEQRINPDEKGSF